MKIQNVTAPLAIGLVALMASGCAHYVKRDDYNATVADLRANDASQRADINATRSDLNNLKSQLDAKFGKYDAAIAQLQGRVRVDLGAHFDYDKAALNDEDKPALDDFASVMRDHHPDALITVEGFTDAAGTPSYNKKLGMKRADAVRDYLVTTGGLAPDKVRTVSYGKDRNRQIEPGAYGDKGAPNRRVALVIDEASSASPSAGTSGS